MNIEDVKDVPAEITLDMVYAEQKKLMEKYKEIEGRHEINLDTREGQQVVKDFLWRITEEVGEALDSDLGINHVKEELADAFHFLIELTIFTGFERLAKETIDRYDPQAPDFNIPDGSLEALLIELARVGRVCKNKPWKQTQIPIDLESFKLALIKAVTAYLDYCGNFFDTKEEIYLFYFKKSQVNHFRQRSGY